MDGKKIKKILAGISVSTLLAGGGLVGCGHHGTTSCSGCGGTEKSRSSCGGSGSSCGGTSCGGQPDDDDTDDDKPKSKYPTPCGGTSCSGN